MKNGVSKTIHNEHFAHMKPFKPLEASQKQ